MPEGPIRFEVAQALAMLTLDDPAGLNPLNAALFEAGLAALARVREDRSIRALVLRSSGRCFSVGADLAAIVANEAGEPGDTRSAGNRTGELMAAGGNPFVQALRELPVPVLCVVNGPTAGGAVGIALAGDIVLAARSAYFYLPFAPSLGLVPDMGGVWFMQRALGRARSLGVSLLGERLDAQRAADWGLIWACVDDALLDSEASRIASVLASLPAHAIGELRSLHWAAESNTLAQQLAFEHGRQQALIDRDSFAEGARAFLEKRRPVFPGR